MHNVLWELYWKRKPVRSVGCQFPRTLLKNCHKPRGLKRQEVILAQFLETGRLKSRYWHDHTIQSTIPFRGSRGESILGPFPACGHISPGENPFQAPSQRPGDSWHPLACGHISPGGVHSRPLPSIWGTPGTSWPVATFLQGRIHSRPLPSLWPHFSLQPVFTLSSLCFCIISPSVSLLFFLKMFILFIWLCWVLFAGCGI